MTAMPTDWTCMPPDGWTLADVEKLPEGSRVEVLDGALIVNPSPTIFHQDLSRQLANALDPQLPAEWRLVMNVDALIAKDPLDYFRPDITVFRSDVPRHTRPIPRESILLAVEVVSKGSRREDRGAKPMAYAEAGVPYYWRVESPASGDALTVVIHTFRLDAGAKEYRATGEHSDVLHEDIGFPISIELKALDS